MKFNRFAAAADKQYEFLKKYATREQGICGITLDDLTFLRYRTMKKTVPQLFKKGEYEKAMFEILKDTKKKITFRRVKRYNNEKKYAFLLWIQDQYEAINKLEATYLSTPPEADLVAAGIRDLDILGDVNLIDNLAQGDVLKWELVQDLPYDTIFNKQLKNTIEARISKNLNKNKKK